MCFDKVDKTDGGVGVGRWVQYSICLFLVSMNIILTLRAESSIIFTLTAEQTNVKIVTVLENSYILNLLLDI